MNDQMPANISPFPTAPLQGGVGDILTAREVQQVLGQMAIAKRFPRNVELSISKVLEECKRKGLAEKATYAFPRGDKLVSGPSIRLAEVFGRCWTNINSGLVELEQIPSKGNEPGESRMMAYAWDLETNRFVCKTFVVRHWRDKRSGGHALTDARDIYEMTANQGARRLRGCILELVPGDMIDKALEQCNKTLQGGAGPLIDRIRAMAQVFGDEFQVTVEMLEKRLRHRLDATSETELVTLRGIYQALRDQQAVREDYFEVEATDTAQAQNLNSRLKAAPAAPAATAPARPAAPEPVRAAPSEPVPAPQAAPAPEKPAPKRVRTVAKAAPEPVAEPIQEPAASAQSFADTGAYEAPVSSPEALEPQAPAAEPAAAGIQTEEVRFHGAGPEIEQPEELEPAGPGDFMFTFGSFVGRKLKSFTMEELAAYLTRLEGAKYKDTAISEAIVQVRAFLSAGQADNDSL